MLQASASSVPAERPPVRLVRPYRDIDSSHFAETAACPFQSSPNSRVFGREVQLPATEEAKVFFSCLFYRTIVAASPHRAAPVLRLSPAEFRGEWQEPNPSDP